MAQTDLIKMAEGKIAGAQAEVDKFLEKFEGRDPGQMSHAMEWSQSAFNAVAELYVWVHILRCFHAPEIDLPAVREMCKHTALVGARTPPSSLPSSNIWYSEVTAAWSRAHDELKWLGPVKQAIAILQCEPYLDREPRINRARNQRSSRCKQPSTTWRSQRPSARS